MDVRFKVGTTKFNFRSAGILIENNHVLLHKQRGDSFWALPGGRIKIGEPSQESVVREMDEELGFRVEAKSVPWIAENFFTYDGYYYHELGFYYLLACSQSHFRSEPFYGLEGERLIYQWIPIDKMKEYDIQPSFLAKGLQNLPTETEHMVVRNSTNHTSNFSV